MAGPWAFGWDALVAIGTLLAAVATAGAAGVAATVYVVSRREARASQASMVSAWLERAAGPENLMAVVQNNSSQPIFDVVSTGGLPEAPTWSLAQRVIPAGESIRVVTPIPVVSPDEQYRPLAVAFRDAAGRRWVRDGGSLRARPPAD
ncbi:MAG: hypothetical protein KQH57_07335 [Actinomycetales bacterium]|nr:hypothetical protein [Actinomycetales bacterium]